MRYLFLIAGLSFTTFISGQHTALQVEPNHSTVGFNISIAGFSIVTGKFTDYELTLDWDSKTTMPKNIMAKIDAASINTGIPDRDDHLRTADFFDVATYPTIDFQSSEIRKIDHAHYEAQGELSMHGVKKSIVIPFEIVKVDGNTIGFKSRMTINRLDFGIGKDFVHTSMPDFLSENIQVEIDFWTKKKKD